MIKGFIDSLTSEYAKGWCFDPERPNLRFEVAVIADGKEIARGMANNFREDLCKVNEKGDFAYTLHFPNSYCNTNVVAIMPEGGIFTLKKSNQIHDKAYQTFADQIGDSDSYAKLQALRLPERYDGLSVLDIGCNEGFFCIDALKRGASNVVGIDINASIIEKAKKREANIQYINTSWWNLPDKQFDIIYFLSAIHYEKHQKDLIRYIMQHLKPNGYMLLECGAIISTERKWYSIQRFDGVLRYPSYDLLVKDILDAYAVTMLNRSVNQAGDPIPRFVLRCSNRNPVVILVTGDSGAGKTNLVKLLTSQSEIINISIDGLLYDIKNRSCYKDDHRNIYSKIVKELNLLEIDNFCNHLSPKEQKLLAQVILDAIPIENKCIILEGYPLGLPTIQIFIKEKLTALGIRCWVLAPSK